MLSQVCNLAQPHCSNVCRIEPLAPLLKPRVFDKRTQFRLTPPLLLGACDETASVCVCVCVQNKQPLYVEELQRRHTQKVQTASSLGLRSHHSYIYLFAAHSHTLTYKNHMYTRLITETRNVLYIYALFSGVCFLY